MRMFGFLAIQFFLLCGSLCGQTQPHHVVEQYDSFSNDWCSLPQLKRKAQRLKDNNFLRAKRLSRKIKRLILKDPEFAKLSTSDAERFDDIVTKGHKPYNHNRLGRENPLIYLGASEVHTDYQEFILASCPKTKKEFLGVLTCFLNRIDVQGVWVSLLSSNEAKNRCNNFWKPDFLYRLHLPHGWAVSKVTSSVIGGEPDKSNAPALTKSRIEIRCGSTRKTIIHYHYNCWYDQTAVPDEDLFLTLLDEMEANTKKEVPIVINCIAGVGRTGMTAVTYLLRKEIQDQLSRGVSRRKVRVNVPKTIYSLRKQRSCLAGNPLHIYKIYSVLGRYCKGLKTKTVVSHAERSY